MMNEDVIEAGIKGYEDYIKFLYGISLDSGWKATPTERGGIRRAVIWAITQYLMNQTDQFKAAVVATATTTKPVKKWKGGKEYERRSRR